MKTTPPIWQPSKITIYQTFAEVKALIDNLVANYPATKEELVEKLVELKMCSQHTGNLFTINDFSDTDFGKHGPEWEMAYVECWVEEQGDMLCILIDPTGDQVEVDYV